MGVIEDFARDYERQFDYWDAAAGLVRGVLEAELISAGLRAIVTSRAKSVDRLVAKLRQRDRDAAYGSTSEIAADIADLAGVRVALYFPGQADEAERIIRSTLDVRHAKNFPAAHGAEQAAGPLGDPAPNATDGAAPIEPNSNRRRFSGYGARHFRVLIPDGRLSTGEERYSSALVEIQLASVLMHAWSEVEHDLVYKPAEGALSSSEHALLDQLNGLVLAGEIALEQLQKAGDARVAAKETPFRDHYELAEYLRTRLSTLGLDLTDATLGRVDVLFDYLSEASSATASSVETYLDQLEQDFENRPVAAQLADLMLSGDRSKYEAFLRAMAVSRHPARRWRLSGENLDGDAAGVLALGEFVAAWVLLETSLRELGISDDLRVSSLAAQLRRAAQLGLISDEQYVELNSLRQLRNQVFHGAKAEVSSATLIAAAAWIRDLTSAIIENAQRD
ncbi:hypothetical protein [Microbacterium maritypicum]|uniref:hypothetical protein n=1 Tax=Microbacterium maritypicum TaxID=33918 RepID=UPI003A9029CA